jgi:luciferase family oxidoreductase group 1
MLPNHSPLVIAEQFGTLESLFPGRIDLGLGRAPGGDHLTARALRRGLGSSGDTFPQDVLELQSYFEPVSPGQAVRAIPGAGLKVPLYLLGSSDFSARLAAELGLPFAFASHFAPAFLLPALEAYRTRFKPSDDLKAPYAMVGIGAFAAGTDAEARRLATSVQRQFINLRRGVPSQLQPPVDTLDGQWSPAEKAGVEQALAYAVVGSPETVRRRLETIIEETKADELIVTAQIFDHAARLRTYEILAGVRDSLEVAV